MNQDELSPVAFTDAEEPECSQSFPFTFDEEFDDDWDDDDDDDDD